MTPIDEKALQAYVGKQVTVEDELRPFPAQALAAALGRNASLDQGDFIPPAWQWLYFLDIPHASATGVDGHPSASALLPPPPLPRRMWAAGDMRIERPLRLGYPAFRRSTIKSIQAKSGRSGPLVFVNLEHEFIQNQILCITEEQNLVYRDASRGPMPIDQGGPAPAAGEWTQQINPDPVLLFRYSALTYNSHRIHYDQAYATQQEFYPGVVVHGPLLATLLLELCQSRLPYGAIKTFRFRAVRPTYMGRMVTLNGTLNGNEIALWSTQDGSLCMSATASLA
ncbi:MAG: hypothetical protein QJR02_00305 [Sinobacteraceae bacterium]|nr:hypothetical protein [Nevskiaceae bacterium]